MRRWIGAVIAVIVAFIATGPGHAQEYPSRPVRILIPLAAGSAVDVVARIVAEKMGDTLGQRIFVENQQGAAGLIGTRAGARATPDGYTILAVNDSVMTMLPNIKADAGYDPLKDFVPITQLVRVHWALVAHPSFRAKSVRELIEYAREKPGSIDYASGGLGSPQHVAMEMFMQMTGVKLNHVPYRGATPALNDVVGGQVPIMFTALPTPLAFVPTNQLRIIATGASTRLPALPDATPLAEAGVPGFDYVTWAALLVPAKTPAEIVNRLHAAAAAALADPGVRARLIELGYEVVGNNPEQFSASLKQDFGRMGEIVRKAGIKID